jgi:hypothetical protein
MTKYLCDPIPVPFDRIYLDPNNPRIAPDDRPGYEDPGVLFDDERQAGLEATLEEIYEDYEELKEAIITQGWVPIDAIIVWEHPKKKGWYVVVEGNTRTLTLRKIRRELAVAKTRLAGLKAAKRLSAAEKETMGDLEARVAELEAIIKDTEELTVYPVNATSAEQLKEILPRLLGVRHITHAQSWKPYPEGLYILQQYEELFVKKHGTKAKLVLDKDLVKQVAQQVSEDEKKARKNIQSAYAFRHFEAEYREKIAATGTPLTKRDHYYFSLILDNRYAADQFRFGKDDLRLTNNMEEVLYKWAFAKPRNGDENQNVFYKAENIRLWNSMKTYDNKKKTSFAAQLNVDEPDDAPPGGFRQLELEYLQHKANRSAIEVIASLIDALKKLNVENLESQASHLRPMLEQMVQRGDHIIGMIDSVNDSRNKKAAAETDDGKPVARKRR